MLYAVKGNKEKTIDESMIESCVQQGYKIVDERGAVIRETVPTDLASLKLAYKKHEETIKALKSTNAELIAKIRSLEAELEELKAKPIAQASENTTSKRKGVNKLVSNE